MGIGADIEKRGHVTGFREELEKLAASPEEFFAWFNNATNADLAFVQGAWDFACHIAPPLNGLVENADQATALEIGHGGGRILAAASRAFGRVIGIDIHDQNELVASELKERGIENALLLKGDGATFPLPDASVDFVYSFIVFQHLEKINTFNQYFAEIARVLKPGGVGVIYFGRWMRHSFERSSPIALWIDRLLENFAMPAGYLELSARVNETNLRVTLKHARNIVERHGLILEATHTSYRGLPARRGRYGGQHGISFRKPLATPDPKQDLPK